MRKDVTDDFISLSGYMFYRMSYQLLMTVSSFEIARCIKKDAYALIFGINFWYYIVSWTSDVKEANSARTSKNPCSCRFALGLMVVLTIVVATEAGLALDIRTQFVVYGAVNLTFGLLFAIHAVYRLCTKDTSAVSPS